MKPFPTCLFCILLCSLLPSGLLLAQERSEAGMNRVALDTHIRERLGPDQELYRGYLFYNAYFQCQGHPYFTPGAFQPGSLRRNGKLYPGLSLKYDCFAQQLILEYSGQGGTYKQLILEGQRIDSFSLGDRPFLKMAPGGGEAAYHQVIAGDSLSSYVHWSCEKIAVSDYSKHYLYRFPLPTATCYIRYRGYTSAIHGKRDFIALFPEILKSPIRSYLREQRFSFRKATPVELEDLVAHVDQCLRNTGSP